SYRYNSDLIGSFYFQYIGKQTTDDTEIAIKPCYLLNMKITTNLLPKVSLELIGNNLLNAKCFYAEFSRRKIPKIPGGYPRAFFILLKTKI
ncbi:MAG: hypothetical protein ACFFDN_51770, partial [Candidatus Hodarchaeota archaeon]